DAAKANLAAAADGFDAARQAARRAWTDVFSRALVTGTDDQKRNFYTALYHLCLQPNDISDAAEGRPFYSTFSCWDTFRAAGPLYTVLMPERAAAFVDSLLAQGKITGYLPIWTLCGVENQCMIGTHSIPMIVDWFLKSEEALSRPLRNAEKSSSAAGGQEPASPLYWESAYRQIKDTLTKAHPGRTKENWDLYDKYGYYPFDKIRGESVSRTYECAYDDWCAGVMAEKLGHKEDAAFFFKRASNWKNVFDPSVGFARGRDSQGNWRTPFSPFALGHDNRRANDFTEGNAWHYTWHVMQDPEGLIAALGGRVKFAEKLASLFVQPEKTDDSGFVADATGLIGQYAHGNEPSHHAIYFFPYVGRGDLTAKYVREVFDRFYLPRPDGLCGNDDCGQMSAWYLFSAMGFYPFNPCGGDYVLGAPQVPEVVLEVGKRTPVRFVITARNLSKENKYVKSVTLNGKPLAGFILKHADILAGGTLVFEMGP
ncbi:MAG: glycoside hydrolase family 92 protein, partial [Kiritimatiellae bacterium]|nr:glycoside hydrolase family 92 protein [Kiritimatiellia bacterium]